MINLDGYGTAVMAYFNMLYKHLERVLCYRLPLRRTTGRNAQLCKRLDTQLRNFRSKKRVVIIPGLSLQKEHSLSFLYDTPFREAGWVGL
jgi:hypothetical protein